MRALRVLLLTAEEMADLDLLFRDSLQYDAPLNAKFLETPTGRIYLIKNDGVR